MNYEDYKYELSQMPEDVQESYMNWLMEHEELEMPECFG